MLRPQRLARIGETHATCQTQESGWVAWSAVQTLLPLDVKKRAGCRHCKQSREWGCTCLLDGTSLIQLWGLHGSSTAGQAILAELLMRSPSPCLDRVLSFNGHQRCPWHFEFRLPTKNKC